MLHEKEEARPTYHSQRATTNNREQSIAQKDIDRFGLWFGLAWLAAWAYAILDAGVAV